MKSLSTNPKERSKFTGNRTAPVYSPSEIQLGHLQAELERIDVYVRLAVMAWQQAGRDPHDAFRGLVISDADAGQLLQQAIGTGWGETLIEGELRQVQQDALAAAAQRAQAWAELAAQQRVGLRLVHLAKVFGLSQFDVDVLLLCLAPALDLRYEQLFSYLQNDISRKRPSVNLTLELLGGEGFRRLQRLSHFAPQAPLLRHRLLEYAQEPNSGSSTLLTQGLQVDRTVVNWLLGSYQPAVELGEHVQLIALDSQDELHLLAPDIQTGVAQIARTPRTLAIFHGADLAAQQLAWRTLGRTLGRSLLVAEFDQLLAQGGDSQAALHLVLRDALLNHAVACLSGWDACLAEQEAPPHLVGMLIDHPDTVVVGGRTSWQPAGQSRPYAVIDIDFPAPEYGLRRQLWRTYLEQYGIDATHLDPVAVAGQFTLTTGQTRDAIAYARNRARWRGGQVEQADLFAGARRHSGAKLTDMARKIEPRYTWDDIILPADQLEILRELVSTVRARSKVLEEWGLGKKLVASAAVTVLFAGPPGTGKTMAAEVIAGDLGLDLYKIDLSNLVSKYIGETEKNLERIFTEAQSSNAILFFDEADAIFGKRSGVKDAHDRYANLEISYLLQRMEIYDGVTILATNLRSNLDEAFMRRLQFAVDIPFPDEKHRLQIWETLFPVSVPRAEDVDLADLAKRFRLAGGNIRNILVSAAYLAAADGDIITMQHLLHGTRREFQKMGRLVLDT